MSERKCINCPKYKKLGHLRKLKVRKWQNLRLQKCPFRGTITFQK